MKYFLYSCLLILVFSPNAFLNAQETCGNIIFPADNSDPDSEDFISPIENCENPFEGVTQAVENITFNGVNLVPNTDLSLPQGAWGIFGPEVSYSFSTELYKKNGDDYYFVRRVNEFDDFVLQSGVYTEAEILNLENEFFLEIKGETTNWRAYERSHPGNPIPDHAVLLVMEFEQSYAPLAHLFTTGNYVLVLNEFGGGPIESSLFQKVKYAFIPTVHAQESPTTFVIPFTVNGGDPTPEPEGASSVLFLPGIMGSRLYEESSVCGNEVEEQERWMSTKDCDQLRMMTDVEGNSINDIYTKDDPSAVIDEAYFFNLYKTFFEALAVWKEEEIIADYALVPYDWRLKLDDILKSKKDDSTGKIMYDHQGTVRDGYLYKTLQNLVADSSTGKVTIVAHSNGGLVAKAFLATLENTNDPLASKIDNLILVGSPQLGTPGTLMGMLQGDEIGPFGTIVSQQTTRTLMNTMPFGFHLLPNESYFSSEGVTVDTPVVRFESGEVTTPWVNTFGATIVNSASLKTFLSTDSGRIKPDVDDLAHPEVVDPYLFGYAEEMDSLTNDWVPPDTINVYQIAGVGLPTVSGITYFTDRECTSRSFPNVFRCATYQTKLGYRPQESIDGDETVVTPSALAMSNSVDNVERWWLNLDAYNSEGIGGGANLNRRHKDIFEVYDVINFVKNTLRSTTSLPYEYLSNTPTDLPEEDRLAFSLHSPLDMSILTAQGKVVSSSSVTVDGAVYRRFGELQYISMPETPGDKTLHLKGQAFGSFTLEIEEYNQEGTVKRHTYSAIPSSTSTKVQMVLNNSVPIEQGVLIVDYDGNGTSEITYDTAGEIVPKVTYTTLLQAINALTIKSTYKKLLLENAKIAEQYHQKSLTQNKFKKLELLALHVLKQQVVLYERLRVMTAIQKKEIVSIVDSLISK